MYIMYGNASNNTPSHAHVFLYPVRRVHPQAYNYDLRYMIAKTIIFKNLSMPT